MSTNIFMIFLLIFSCNQKNEDHKITGIKATAVFPDINFSTGKVEGYDTSIVYVFNSGNLVIYKMFERFDSLFPDTIKYTYSYNYFIHRKGKNAGIIFNKNNSYKGEKIAIDSVFKYKWFARNKLYPIFTNINDVKIRSSYSSKDLDTTRESYFIKSRSDTNQSANVFLEYNKSMSDYEFTISKELDSLKKMKLVKMKIVMNPMKVNNDLTIDKYETYYEFHSFIDFDRQEVQRFIDRFNSIIQQQQ